MKVHLNKTVGYIVIIACALNLFLFFSTLFGETKPDFLSGAIGVIGIVVGVLYLRGDYFEIADNNLILKALVNNGFRGQLDGANGIQFFIGVGSPLDPFNIPGIPVCIRIL